MSTLEGAGWVYEIFVALDWGSARQFKIIMLSFFGHLELGRCLVIFWSFFSHFLVVLWSFVRCLRLSLLVFVLVVFWSLFANFRIFSSFLIFFSSFFTCLLLFFSESFGDLGEHGQKNKNTNGKSEKGPEHVNNITKPCLKNAKQ